VGSEPGELDYVHYEIVKCIKLYPFSRNVSSVIYKTPRSMYKYIKWHSKAGTGYVNRLISQVSVQYIKEGP
jgi:hypothetical protein